MSLLEIPAAMDRGSLDKPAALSDVPLELPLGHQLNAQVKEPHETHVPMRHSSMSLWSRDVHNEDKVRHCFGKHLPRPCWSRYTYRCRPGTLRRRQHRRALS